MEPPASPTHSSGGPWPSSSWHCRDDESCVAPPTPPPAHQSVRIVPKTDPRQPGCPGAGPACRGGGLHWLRGRAENKDRGPALRPWRRSFDTRTHSHTHTLTHSNTHRDILKHKFLSDLPAPSFLRRQGTCRNGVRHPRDLGATRALSWLHLWCVSDLPSFLTQPSGFTRREPEGEPTREPHSWLDSGTAWDGGGWGQRRPGGAV